MLSHSKQQMFGKPFHLKEDKFVFRYGAMGQVTEEVETFDQSGQLGGLSYIPSRKTAVQNWSF